MEEPVKERPAVYTHIDQRKFDCTILRSTPTMHFVRLTEEAAQELDLADELWLPAGYIKLADDRER